MLATATSTKPTARQAWQQRLNVTLALLSMLQPKSGALPQHVLQLTHLICRAMKTPATAATTSNWAHRLPLAVLQSNAMHHLVAVSADATDCDAVRAAMAWPGL